MYNFDILIKKEEPIVEFSFEEMDIDIAEMETPDIEPEFVSVTLRTKFFESYQKAHGVLSNVRKHLMEKGCTKELVAIMNPQLLDHGIILEVGQKQDAMYSIESLMEKIDINKIKETLMKIIDAIINLIQKFYDQNKNDTNTLKDILRTKLYDTSKYDTRKFAGVIGAVYPYDDFVDLAEGFTRIKLLNEVESGEDLSKSISPKLTSLLKTAGYQINTDSITRDDSFIIPKDTMESLGWEPSKLRNAAEMTRIMLETIRKNHSQAVDALKKEASAFDGDSEDRIKLVDKLNNIMRAIATIERVSLILSRQVIALTNLLKVKTDASNESIGEVPPAEDVDSSTESTDEQVDKKTYKKKVHVENCPCMDKDATSCQCECPFEEEEPIEE